MFDITAQIVAKLYDLFQNSVTLHGTQRIEIFSSARQKQDIVLHQLFFPPFVSPRAKMLATKFSTSVADSSS